MNTLPWFVKTGGLFKSFQETYPDDDELDEVILAIPKVHMFVVDDFNLTYDYEGDYESFLRFAKKCHFWDCNFPWFVYDFIIRSTQTPSSFCDALCNEVDELDRNARALKYFTRHDRSSIMFVNYKLNAIKDPDLLDYVAYELQIDCFPKPRACCFAVQYGNLDYIKLFHDWGCPWSDTCSQAIQCKKYDILEYAIKNGAIMTSDDINFVERNLTVFENADGSRCDAVEFLVRFDNLETLCSLESTLRDKCILGLISIAIECKANQCLRFLISVRSSSEFIDICYKLVIADNIVGMGHIAKNYPSCLTEELFVLAVKNDSDEVLKLMSNANFGKASQKIDNALELLSRCENIAVNLESFKCLEVIKERILSFTQLRDN